MKEQEQPQSLFKKYSTDAYRQHAGIKAKKGKKLGTSQSTATLS